MNKLTTTQLQELFTFVKKHYVEYYDVQLELVDHLANDIEQQWVMDPTLSFDDALHIAFKRFGVFGFTEMVGHKVNALTIFYYKRMGERLLDFISWPKIVLTGVLYIALYYTLFKLTTVIPIKEYIGLFLLSFAILGIGYLCYKGIIANKKADKKQMKLLLERAKVRIIVLPTLLYFPFFNALLNITDYNLFMVSFLLLVVFLVTFIFARNILPGIAKEREAIEKILVQSYQQMLV